MDLLQYLHHREKRAASREVADQFAWPGNRLMKSNIAYIAEFPLTGPSPVSGATRRVKLLATLVGLQTDAGRQFVRAVANVVELAASQRVQHALRFSLIARDGEQCVVAEIVLDADTDETSDVLHGTAFEKQLETLRTLVDHVNVYNGACPIVHLAQVLPKGAVPLTKSDVSNWAELLDSKSPSEALMGSQRQVQRIANEFTGVRQKYTELAEQVERMRSENATWNLLARVASETTNSVVIVGRDGRIEWVNHAFETLTGIRSDQAVGEPFEELLFDNSDSDLATRLRQALRHGQAVIGERSHIRPDGKQYWCSFNLSPLRDEDGQLAGWVDIGSDTTAARQAREDLERAMHTAEAANRAKSEFLANMSHEIRTPMNAILGMTELVLGTQLNDQQREYLTTAKDSAQTLLQILNDILDLSKIEAHRLELEEIEFNLADWLRETMRTLSVQADIKGLEVNWHLPLDVPQDLRGDPTRLRQVLVNLVGNAIKFTPQGEVIVSVEKQWASDGEVGLQFSVHDTGIGIPADRLEKIFEAFTQGDASTTRKFGGTGLGLKISAELLRLMHGRIRVDSTVGKGSTFFFTVRLGLASGPDRTLSQRTTDKIEGRRVLVVDDNATNRRILAEHLNILIADDHHPNRQLIGEILRQRGHRFQEASSGREVLELLHQEAFDVVLMDVQMPEMDGFETTAAIRTAERATWTHQPIVAVTAYAMKGDHEKCLASGMDAYLSKPIDAGELIRLVETLAKATPDSDNIQLPAGEPLSHQAVPERPKDNYHPSLAAIDFGTALNRLAGNRELLKRQMSFFLVEAPKLVEQMRTSIDDNDANGLKLAAHRLKGLISSYDQRKAAETAQQLEELSVQDRLAETIELAESLARHVEQLTTAIRDYANG